MHAASLQEEEGTEKYQQSLSKRIVASELRND